MQLFVQIEAAHDTVDELGKVGLVQFRDVCLCELCADFVAQSECQCFPA